jgi:hypothetical protein
MRTQKRQWRWWPWLLLAAGVWGLSGCANLCTKHLLLYREAAARGRPTSGQALLLTDPQLAQALAPGAVNLNNTLPWAPDQPFYQSDCYQLSMDRVNDQPVYQGLCLDTTSTYSLEVGPGGRQLQLRLDLFGSWGKEAVREAVAVDLKAGGVYFLYPEGEAAKRRQLVLKVQPLLKDYDAKLRQRVMDWNRQHYPARTIAD